MKLSKIASAIVAPLKKGDIKKIMDDVKIDDCIKKTDAELTKTLDCLSSQLKATTCAVKKLEHGGSLPLPTSSRDFVVGANMLKAKGLNTNSTSISYLKELPTEEFEKLKTKAMDSVENGVENGIKSAKDSFSAINAARENAYLDSQLAHKSARGSAYVIENDPKVKQQWLKEDLMQKHGEQYSAKKAQAQRKADLMAKYGHKLHK